MSEFKTIENIDRIPHEERKRWHDVGRICVLALTAVACGCLANLYMANTPSADDAVRGTVLTLIGTMFGSYFRPKGET